MFYLIAGVAAAIALYQLVSTNSQSHPPPTRSQSRQSHEGPHHERSRHEGPRHEDHRKERPRQEHPRHALHQDLLVKVKDPVSLRAKASQRGQMMAQCFQQSQEAYERRDHVLAKSLSEQGKRHELKMEQLNAEASTIIFKENNRVPLGKDLVPLAARVFQDRPPSEVDLHGLHVKEAIRYAEKALKKAFQRSDPELHFIVGQGNHSDGGISKLKPAILAVMQRRGFEVEVDPRNPGVLVVVLDN